jgi:2-polyprenyl-6-methoxyphenol hydroxylase-like FAD-dependent oxidoreductase
MESVLVVGAGPTGLVMALSLARRGVPVHIIDNRDGPTRESRAMGL